MPQPALARNAPALTPSPTPSPKGPPPPQSSPSPTARHPPKTVLAATCGAHAVHDGYTDTLYLLLPLWQTEFALSHGAVGLMRALYSAVLAGLQVPAASLSARIDPVLLLAGGTALSGLAYILAGTSAGLALLAASLILGGAGSATQHPIGADLVARAFPGHATRQALGTYNFAGDIGKMAFPAGASLLLAFLTWRQTAFAVGGLGTLAALGLLWALPVRRWRAAGHGGGTSPKAAPVDAPAAWGEGFHTLLGIGMADLATRTGFMTFLPFLLTAKGAAPGTIGVALALTFAGGAFGKLACGFIGARLGVVRTIAITKAATAALILAVPLLAPAGILALLPLLGTMLNGTSSVIYGSVPDFAPAGRQARAFGVFYTATIGASAMAPIAFGMLSDAVGLQAMMTAIAGTAIVTLLMAPLLAGKGNA